MSFSHVKSNLNRLNMEKIQDQSGTHEVNHGKMCSFYLKKYSRCKKENFIKIYSDGKIEEIIQRIMI